MYMQKTWNNWNTLIISMVTAFFLEQKPAQTCPKTGTKYKGVDKNATSKNI